MLPVVSTPAGTSGVFVGARQGQGFVVESDYRDPSRAVVWVPVVLLVLLIVI